MNRKRIAMASTSWGGYSETFIRQQAEGLCDVVEVFYGRPFPQFYGDGKSVTSVPRTILGRVARKFLVDLTCGSYEDYEILRFSTLLKRLKIDVVLAQYGMTGVAIMKSCELAGVPLVVHFHGYDAHMGKVVSQYEASYAVMGTKAAAVVVVSIKMRDALVSYGIPPEKVHLIPYGVDIEKFSYMNAGDNPPHFLAVGRMVEKKAPYLTLLAFSKVVSGYPEAHLHFIGEGELLETVQTLITALGLSRHVTVHGKLTPESIINLMRKCRAFVQHSVEPRYGEKRGDSEGSPVAILEAASCGLPIIATHHAGIEQSVLHGETGFLVDERDIVTMSSYMEELAENPALATTFGQAGREHIERNYESRNALGLLNGLLENVARS